jgi:hypothetical protein
MKLLRKKGFQMSFAWIFAIFVGAIILFLAIYFALQISESGEYEINTETAKAISNLLNPLLTGSESAKSDKIILTSETRIYTSCELSGNFGGNTIQISEASRFQGKEWSALGGNIPVTKNQYIFSENMIETKNKKLYFLILPIYFPFKTADSMIWHTDQYCFVSPPIQVDDFVRAMSNEENMVAVESIDKCEEESVKVCFSNLGGCDVTVEDRCDGIRCEHYSQGVVIKDGKNLFYVNEFLYPAIFSSSKNYECGVKRIMMRLEKLSLIYKDKSQLSTIRGCSSGLSEDMTRLNLLASSYQDLENLRVIEDLAEEIKNKNRGSVCQLF